MPASPRAYRLLLLLLAAPALVWAKSSDRTQPVNIDAGYSDGNFDDNGKTVLTGGVIVTQGTLDIRSDRAEITMRNGDPALAVFTGTPVKLKQQMDDGTWMDAIANRITYDMNIDTITFDGNYTVSSPKGSNSGQHMVYNTKSGNMQAGGDGTRVKTVIKPKSSTPPPN